MGLRWGLIAPSILLVAFTMLPSGYVGAPTSPDFNTCMPHIVMSGGGSNGGHLGLMPMLNCCAPSWVGSPLDFSLLATTHSPSPRVRMPAHLIDEELASKLNKAYQLMKALPDDDPRSFYQQAKIHCSYCNYVHKQANVARGSNASLYQIHGTWLFFPFHRWYLYFHERILGHLIGDLTLAIPFWNYDSRAGADIPGVYNNPSRYPYLTDASRNLGHSESTVVSLDYVFNPWFKNRSREEQVEINLKQIRKVMVDQTPTPERFLGKAFRGGDNSPLIEGSSPLEYIPHGAVHLWVGGNMQYFDSAGFDPVFYPHHANLDRLWEVWKGFGLGGIEDPDFLNSEFLLYDEHARLRRVTVRDSIYTEKMGFTYFDVENEWISPRYSASECRNKGVEEVKMVKKEKIDHHPIAVDSHLPQVTKMSEPSSQICKLDGSFLSSPCSLTIPLKVPPRGTHLETILVITIMLVPSSNVASFEVFINLPQANASTPISCTANVGTFFEMPRIGGMANPGRRTMHLAITPILGQLKLLSMNDLVVTLVPPHPNTTLSINNVTFEYIETMTQT